MGICGCVQGWWAECVWALLEPVMFEAMSRLRPAWVFVFSDSNFLMPVEQF
jgi:hypothetical protein